MVHNYRDTVTAKGKIKQMLFGHFNKCLYPIQKFDSDTERRFSVIIERDCEKSIMRWKVLCSGIRIYRSKMVYVLFPCSCVFARMQVKGRPCRSQ